MENCISETYKNSVILNGWHIYQTASDMAMEKMWAYPPSQHALPHWSCMLRCCVNFPPINIPRKKLYKHHSNTCPKTSFHVYHLISCCTAHGRCIYDERKMCCLCVAWSHICATCNTIYMKWACYYWDINLWILHKFLHSRNKNYRSTCHI